MPLTIIRQDITRMRVDAIVNASNARLRMGGGVCGAIFRAAGEEDMAAACVPLAPVAVGDCAITPGFRLPSRYVIHAVGPIYQADASAICEEQLRSAYINALRLAKRHNCESVAFPLISSGTFGYPKDEALRVAMSSIRAFLSDNDMDVYLAVLDRGAFRASEQLLGEVRSYVDDTYVDLLSVEDRSLEMRQVIADAALLSDLPAPESAARPKPKGAHKASYGRPVAGASLEEMVGNLDESFSQTLLRLIDAKGRSDPEVYRRANLDRKLFSKIRAGRDYTPAKRTALALAISLELTLEETADLLGRAGYALSHSQRFDVIIEYFLLHRRYDIDEINSMLFQYDLPTLGG